MRKSIVIAIAIASSFAITACGNGKHSMRGKVEAARLTHDKGQQKENIKEIEEKIEGTKKSMSNIGFKGMESGVVATVTEMFSSVKPEDRPKLKGQLSSIKTHAENLIRAGKDVKGSEGDAAIKKGEEYIKKADASMAKLNADEQSSK